MHTSLPPLQTIIRLNTRLFKNCLANVSDEVAARVVAQRTNTMLFVALHVFDGRIFMVETVGAHFPHPYPEVAAAQRVEDIVVYPRLADLVANWNRVSLALENCVESLSDEQLRKPSSKRFPVEDKSLMGALSFLVQHESYHIGQLSLLRRIHGLSAMRYSGGD